MKINKSWYIKPKGVPEHDAAGGIVIRKENGKIYFATTYEIDVKALVLPKGHVEKGESFENAARREIKEETGLIKLNIICFLGMKERFGLDKTSWKKTHYFLFITEQIKGIPSDPKHKGMVWLRLSDYKKHLWPEQRELIKENLEKIAKTI
jgi:8-oxo-dGTP pyrophosphatase MutT (NUDIX family)